MVAWNGVWDSPDQGSVWCAFSGVIDLLSGSERIRCNGNEDFKRNEFGIRLPFVFSYKGLLFRLQKASQSSLGRLRNDNFVRNSQVPTPHRSRSLRLAGSFVDSPPSTDLPRKLSVIHQRLGGGKAQCRSLPKSG